MLVFVWWIQSVLHAQSLPSCKHIICFLVQDGVVDFLRTLECFHHPHSPFLLLTQKDRCLNVFVRGIIAVLLGLLTIRVLHCPRMAPLAKALLIPRKATVHFGFMQFLENES